MDWNRSFSVMITPKRNYTELTLKLHFIQPLGEGQFIVGSGPKGVLIEWEWKSPNISVIRTLYTIPLKNPLTLVDFAAPTPCGRLIGGALLASFCGSNVKFSIYRYASGLVELTPNNHLPQSCLIWSFWRCIAWTYDRDWSFRTTGIPIKSTFVSEFVNAEHCMINLHFPSQPMKKLHSTLTRSLTKHNLQWYGDWH